MYTTTGALVLKISILAYGAKAKKKQEKKERDLGIPESLGFFHIWAAAIYLRLKSTWTDFLRPFLIPNKMISIPLFKLLSNLHTRNTLLVIMMMR